MYEIEITDRQSLLPLEPTSIEQTTRTLLDSEQVKSAVLSLVFVDDAEIHQINRNYLQHDYPTDVISFLLNERQPPSSSDSAGKTRGFQQHIEGEVIISTETAVREAKYFNWSPDEEMLLYVIHGLLHLAGYDDLSDDERSLMRRREEDILHLCGLEPPVPEMDVPPGESMSHDTSPQEEDFGS